MKSPTQAHSPHSRCQFLESTTRQTPGVRAVGVRNQLPGVSHGSPCCLSQSQSHLPLLSPSPIPVHQLLQEGTCLARGRSQAVVPLSILLFHPGFNVQCWCLDSVSPVLETVRQHPHVSMGGETLLWVRPGARGHATL